MDNTQGIVIAMGISLGLVLIYGIYRLATSRLHEKSVFKPGTATANGRQTAKTVFTIIGSILVFAALILAWQFFTSNR